MSSPVFDPMDVATFTQKLVESGVLDAAQAQVSLGRGIGATRSSKVLLGASNLTPDAFADLLASCHNLPRVGLDAMRSGVSLADGFSIPFLRDNGLFPYRASNGSVTLATADPFNRDALDAIALTLAADVRLQVATFDDIELALDSSAASARAAAPVEAAVAEPSSDDSDSLRDLASGAPVVRALDDIFDQAVALRATDIHLEPQRREIRIRVRVDGVMRALAPPRGIEPRALVSRVKILAGLNIAERRLPQDGRMAMNVRSRNFDVRVATMPTTAGEAAILRLLDRGGRLVEFDQLGFNARDAAVFRQRLLEPHGMIIVTGPTGSGKTTTLAAALATLNDSTRKILTIEDPVEYEIAGVAQSQVRPAVGLTFASALRAFLRQDPDVIMVGEVRDPETAKIAVQASLTGHLVMTTLHTNTAASAITRLVDIGIERYLIASTLTAVIGQRLLRTLCVDCRRRYSVGAADLQDNPRIVALGIEAGATLYAPVGCERCGHTGYRGRQAIFEVLAMTEQVRRRVLAGADDPEIERVAMDDGMTTMGDDGRARCLAGITSVEEVFRVTAVR